MVVCVHLPRFELVLAAGGAQALVGRALAIAPPTGSDQRLGEVSGAAEAQGVRRGMTLGEALARCPDLALVPADPVGVDEAWQSMLDTLESIGAAVEPARPGLAYFETDPLRSLHGTDAAVIAAAQRAVWQSGGARRGNAPHPGGRSSIGGERHARIGAGPTRFCSLAAALAVRSRRALVLDGSDALRWLAGRPIELLGYRAQTEQLLEPLMRLGVRTLGELVGLGRDELADRFGAPGVLAHRLACGEDAPRGGARAPRPRGGGGGPPPPLHPRSARARIEETMNVGDASSGQAIERVLGVLVDRLLARSDRRGRTLRAVTLSARLLPGGGWRERVVFRQPLADRDRISLALSLRLLLLPAPAASLGLAVERFGPPAGEQRALLEESHVARAARLREAVAQVRTVAGEDAAMRVVCVDPDSRVPERRVVLTPLPG
jgi:protein ImuB